MSQPPDMPKPNKSHPLIVGIVAAVIASAILIAYFVWPRQDPLPSWVSMPSGYKVAQSRAAPADAPKIGPRYYLRIQAPAEPRAALLEFAGQLPRYKWDSAEKEEPKESAKKEPKPKPVRAAAPADVSVRAGWPAWIQKELYKVNDPTGGAVLSSTTLPTHIYLHAWPSGGGAIIELIEEQTQQAPP